jgi:hypothetical protein
MKDLVQILWIEGDNFLSLGGREAGCRQEQQHNNTATKQQSNSTATQQPGLEHTPAPQHN